jgi:GNAT superfamily N-acetyltransferase
MKIEYAKTIHLGNGSEIQLRQEYLQPEEYIDFLKRSDLGQQYPKEDFHERIGKLVQNVQISLVARNEARQVIGVCFGLTDFAYWLLATDLGVDRKYERMGLGKELMRVAHELAGGEKKIIAFAYANEDAIPFYRKIGMRESKDMMEKTNIEWTEFVVE